MIERLRRHEMEAEARELGQLRGRVAELETRRSTLLDDLNREAQFTSIEAAPYLGNYIRSVRAEVIRIDTEIDDLDTRCEALEHNVRARYRDMRTVGALLARGQARRAEDRLRRDTAQAEEQALMRWMRRDA